MITERTNRKGKKVIVVDLVLTRKDGTKERYRKDARIQTTRGAKLEEESVLRTWFESGTIMKLIKPEVPEPVVVHTFKDALKYYRQHGLLQLKESSRRSFKGMYEGPRFERWMPLDVTKITTRSIREWQDEIITSLGGKADKVSKSLLRMHRAALMAVLKDVGPIEEEPGLMLATLPKFPKLPKNLAPPKEIKAPPELDVDRLIAAASPELRFAFCLLAWTGMRPCELRALTKGQVNLTTLTITIDRAECYGVTSSTKTGRERQLPIDPELVPMLTARLEQLAGDDALVSVDANGESWRQHGLSNGMRALAKKLGLKDARLYGLRHYRGTMLASVTDIKTISVILGHAKVSTTQRYISTDMQRMRAATEALAAARTKVTRAELVQQDPF